MHYGPQDGGEAYDQHMMLTLPGDIPEDQLHTEVLLQIDELIGFNGLNETP